MENSVLTSWFVLPPGSFEFTPEGYINRCYWQPDDAFTWAAFANQSFKTVEELEARKAEFIASTSGKFEIIDAHYWERSLRNLLPKRWGLGYQRDGSYIQRANEEKRECYARLKQSLYYKSIILGYGVGKIDDSCENKKLILYIKEHCASSARLKAISLRAYEYFGNIKGFHVWTSNLPAIYLSLAAAISSLDSLVAVLMVLLTGKLPDKKVPSMTTVFYSLCPDLKPKSKQLRQPFGDEFLELYESEWFKSLREARDTVVHRGGSAITHDEYGAAFDFDLGMFSHEPQSGNPRVDLEESIRRISFDRLIVDFVLGLEQWEQKHAVKLASLAKHHSLMTDGILLGIQFWRSRDLDDGSGPNHIVYSREAN